MPTLTLATVLAEHYSKRRALYSLACIPLATNILCLSFLSHFVFVDQLIISTGSFSHFLIYPHCCSHHKSLFPLIHILLLSLHFFFLCVEKDLFHQSMYHNTFTQLSKCTVERHYNSLDTIQVVVNHDI